MTIDRLTHLQKQIHAYYEQLECQENALLTCKQGDRSSIKQQMDSLTQEIIPIKRDYWNYWSVMGARQLEITDLQAAVINAEIVGEIEMLKFQREVQHHLEVVKLLDRLESTLTKLEPAAGKLREIIPLLPEFLTHDLDLDTEGLLRRVFPIFATLKGQLTKDISSERGRESVFQSPAYAADRPQPTQHPRRLFGATKIRKIAEWVGRDKLLAELRADCLHGRRAIVLWGQSGIGKTSLAVKLMEACGVDLALDTLSPGCPYDNALYCSINSVGASTEHENRFDFLADEFLSAFGMAANRIGATPAQTIEMIVTKLAAERWLIVIDNLEVLLEADSGRSKSPEVGDLIHRLAYGAHKSQIVMTSKKLPADLVDRGGKKPIAILAQGENRQLIRSEAVRGISTSDSIQLLKNLRAENTPKDLQWIADRVQGNIFVLKLLADYGRDNPSKLRQTPDLVTKEAMPIVRAQWATQEPAAQELLQRMCVLRQGVNVTGLTKLRLLQPDGGELESTSAAKETTMALLARAIESGLVESAYDPIACEPIYELHPLVAQTLQTVSQTDLERLWQYATILYASLERPTAFRSLADWRLVLEEWHFFWLLRHYQEISRMAIDFLIPQLGRWGYSSLQQEWCQRILPHTEESDYRFCLETLGGIYRDAEEWNDAEHYFQLSLTNAEETASLSAIATSSAMLGNIARSRGHWDEARTLLQKSLRIRTELNDRHGMAANLGSLGDVARQLSNWAEAKALFQKSLKIHTELGDRLGKASSWSCLGDIARKLSNWEEAESMFHRSLALHAELGDRAGIATNWGCLGDVAREQGKWDEAEALFQKSLKLRTELGDRSGMATNWGCLGDIACHRGNWDEAESLYQKSLKLRNEVGDFAAMATAWSSLGDVAHSRGNWDEAESLYQKSLKLHTEVGDTAAMATDWAVLGDIARQRNNWAEAETLYQKSLKLRTEVGDLATMANDYSCLGDMARQRRNWDEAESFYRKSLKLHTELGDGTGMAKEWDLLGDIARERGNWNEAQALYQKSLKLRGELGDRTGTATNWGVLGDLARQRGNWDEAETFYYKALKIRTELGDRVGMTANWRILADIARQRGNWDEAETLYRKSLRLQIELGDGSGMATNWGDLGDIACLRGEWDEAETLYRKSLRLHTELGDGTGMARNWSCLGDIARQRGNWDEAEALYQKCLRLHTELGDGVGIAMNLGDLGKNELGRGNLEAAKTLLTRALSTSENLKQTDVMAATNWDLAQLYRAQGDRKRAQAHYSMARNLYAQLGATRYVAKIEAEWENNIKTTAGWSGIVTRYFPTTPAKKV